MTAIDTALADELYEKLLLQRETDIFATFDVAHYRPKEHPNMVRVIDDKTGSESWIPLFDDVSVPLYPELMTELDDIKRSRIGGLMLRRDWGSKGPWPTWPTWPKPEEPNFTHMSRKVKQVIRAAELHDEQSFASFRCIEGQNARGEAALSEAGSLPKVRAEEGCPSLSQLVA